jgi:hypothetical protein
MTAIDSFILDTDGVLRRSEARPPFGFDESRGLTRALGRP